MSTDQIILNSINRALGCDERTPELALSENLSAAQELYSTDNNFRKLLSLSEEMGAVFSESIIEAVTNNDDEGDDEDEPSDEELDAMIAHINDWDDVIDAYDPDELSIVDQETGEEIHSSVDESTELNEVLSRAERIKSRMRFARTAGKRERKLQVALKHRSNAATINKRARHLAVKTPSRITIQPSRHLAVKTYNHPAI